MKVLFLSRWFPYPPDNGSRIRILNMLKILASRHEVDLVSFVGKNPTSADLESMRGLCNRVTLVPYKPFEPDNLQSLLGYLSRSPRSARATFSPSMQESVDEVWRTKTHDVVIASQLDMAPYAQHLAGGVRVLEELELTSFWDQVMHAKGPLEHFRRSLMWWKLAGYVRNLLNDFDACTVVSEQEKARLCSLGPLGGTIAVIPNGIDMELLDLDFGPPMPETLVYSGSLTYSANYEAVDYFTSQILPIIRRAKPSATLLVTGSTEGVSTDRVTRGGGVKLTGYLKDIRPTIGSAWLSVVPLLSGGGTRVKVLESLALGTPVISTSKGAEGLDLRPGRDLIVADTPEEFAQSVIGLLDSPQSRSELSQNGRKAVAEEYGWPRVGERTLGLLDSLRPRTAPRTYSRLLHAT